MCGKYSIFRYRKRNWHAIGLDWFNMFLLFRINVHLKSINPFLTQLRAIRRAGEPWMIAGLVKRYCGIQTFCQHIMSVEPGYEPLFPIFDIRIIGFLM